MKRFGIRIPIAGRILAAWVVAAAPFPAQHRPATQGRLETHSQETPRPAALTIDYPADTAIFPPEITAPTFLWHDSVPASVAWRIDVTFADGSSAVHAKSRGERLPAGKLGDKIDPRSISETNQPPPQSDARAWTPDSSTWNHIKRHSVAGPAQVTISGIARGQPGQPGQVGSRGAITMTTSSDPVGAPIFYRDVPLMPSEVEKGVIKPLVPAALPLIGWRLRDIGEPNSVLLMENLPTCANCHSFSRDGKTLGMDVDGPRNDKGTYAIAPIRPRMSIGSQDVITWNSFADKTPGLNTIGFMSQISPDGRYAITTINEAVYVANFKDYRFLQVFYPTRGILAWYDRATGRMERLPGADDARYVQTGAVWSPDGRYLVFARAEAKDPYPPGRPAAAYANDPNEVQIQYDLYRIPFHQGKGGLPEPVAGAARNGMSNSFPKVSPDGRWIVFVESRNGQLMRPDSLLYIVPAAGGEARRMRCNTALMNSWHSFSPNGRWLVFSSKSRSPYTQMFLTHLDEEGRDSPAILIGNATAANRAVNLPEFVNIPKDGLLHIDMPAAEFYRISDLAWELAGKGRFDAAIAEWKKALGISPQDSRTHNYLGSALVKRGKIDEGIAHFQKAVEIDPGNAEARVNLGVVELQRGQVEQAMAHFRGALGIDPKSGEAQDYLARALAAMGQWDDAIAHWQLAVELAPRNAEAHNGLGTGLFRKGRLEEATAQWQRALEIRPEFAEPHFNLGNAEYVGGNLRGALGHWRAGLKIAPDNAAVLNQTARLLATCPDGSIRNGGEAVRLAERAVQLSGGRDAGMLDTLAASYGEAGRFEQAVAAVRRAMAQVTGVHQEVLAATLKARLALYLAGRPAREDVVIH